MSTTASAHPRPLLTQLQKYWGLMRIGVQVWMAYRISGLVELIEFPLIIGVYYCLFTALYASLPEGAAVGGLDLAATITYISLVWAVESLINTKLDMDLAMEVRDGRVGTLLSRPIDLQAYYLALSVGHISFRLFTMCLPIALIAALFFKFEPPAPGALPLFLVSLIGAFMLYFLLNYCLGLAAFFFEWNYGMMLIKETLTRGLGGLLIPLTLLPPNVLEGVMLTPFPYLYYVPVQAYLGHPGIETLIVAQYGWCVVMFGVSRLLQWQAMKFVTVQGG